MREGVNESQKNICYEYELKDNIKVIKDTIKKLSESSEAPKIMIIFVNDKNDTKIFSELNNNLEVSGIENFDLTQNTNEISVGNAPLGTIVNHESGITLNSKHYEFYINSSSGNIGLSNFTKYTVLFDDSQIDNKIYALMYNLCFLYFNNPLPIKTPAPLYYAIRMNNYVIRELGFVPKRMDLVNFSL